MLGGMELKLIQPLSQNVTQDVTTLEEFTASENLSQTAQDLIQYTRSSGRKPPSSRANIALQFESTFELIGGVPRLALWADQNPGAFYSLFSKLIPNAVKADLTVINKSDLETITTDDLKRMLIERAQNP